MSSFESNKRHLRELLIYFFNLKKSAETYDEAALSERSCRKWFQKFKNGEFDIEDKECSERPKVYEDAELEALFSESGRGFGHGRTCCCVSSPNVVSVSRSNANCYLQCVLLLPRDSAGFVLCCGVVPSHAF